MQIPILSGIFTDSDSEFRTSYPKNMIPVVKSQGISAGFLRPAEGINKDGLGPGVGRGGINWLDNCYRVMGNKIVRIGSDFNVKELGDIPGTERVTMDYSFDDLGVVADNKFYLWNPSDGQREVTDPDLGNVFDFVWVDGYFMLTDGEFLIVTELNDPFQINPTKYGSSEADPDPIKALLKVRNEPYALNRYTIEVFDNVGGTGFPFQRIDGAQVMRGTIGTHTCCVFLESVAFLGGGRGESLAVWIATSGSSVKLSTRDIDIVLSEYSEAELSKSIMEARVDKGHQFLYLHLPDQTLVYDASSSRESGVSVWFTLTTSISGKSLYRARDFVWCYDKWLCTDPKSFCFGSLVSDSGEHWGEEIGWEFSTSIIYNDGLGAIFHRVELEALTGRSALGVDARISSEYSLDGVTYSTPRFIKVGSSGKRNKRLVWLQQGNMERWRIQRFSGTSKARMSPARLDIQLERLAV